MGRNGVTGVPLSRGLIALGLLADAATAIWQGRARRAVRLLALAALAYRWTAAGIDIELGRRIVRRRR